MAARRHKPKPRGASRTRSAPAKKPVPGWIWLVSGLVIGGFFVFLSQLKPGSDEVKRRPAGTPEKTVVSKPAPPPTPPRPKYEFYEELTKATPAPLPGNQPTPEQIQAAEAARAQALLEGRTPPPRLVATPPAPSTATQAPPPTASKPPAAAPAATPAAAEGTRFILQAGSFASREQAESARAQLILLGQDARIESGKVDDKTWYRVVVGPFVSRQQADSARKLLALNGVGSVIQQRR